jgi:hypothetical protein
MIISPKFIWLHFPKCAGTKIEYLFAKYLSHIPGVTQDVIDPSDSSASWHDSIADREERDAGFQLGNRAIICSYRQLPSWLESRYSFEKKRSPRLPHQPQDLLEGRFLEWDGYRNHADYYPKKYLPEALLNSGKVRFIRTEFFQKDFISVFGDYLDLSAIPEKEYASKENSSTSALPPNVKTALYNHKTLYNLCPYWKKCETMAYTT